MNFNMVSSLALFGLLVWFIFRGYDVQTYRPRLIKNVRSRSTNEYE